VGVTQQMIVFYHHLFYGLPHECAASRRPWESPTRKGARSYGKGFLTLGSHVAWIILLAKTKKNILNGLGLCNDRPEWAELWSHVVLKRAEP
jgi:hypothetical protein